VEGRAGPRDSSDVPLALLRAVEAHLLAGGDKACAPPLRGDPDPAVATAGLASLMSGEREAEGRKAALVRPPHQLRGKPPSLTRRATRARTLRDIASRREPSMVILVKRTRWTPEDCGGRWATEASTSVPNPGAEWIVCFAFADQSMP
jgi:hypothetical protein